MITASVLKGLKRKCFSVLRQKQSCSHGVKDGCKNLQLLVLYYASIISDRFLVRSKTIHHILQPNGNRNLVGSIRHVSYFHLERYDKMIKIVHYVIHINFLIKSTDSCWKLRRGQHETSRKIYIKLRSIVKNLGLKKIKTKNILADSRKLKCREKIPQNFSGLTMISRH